MHEHGYNTPRKRAATIGGTLVALLITVVVFMVAGAIAGFVWDMLRVIGRQEQSWWTGLTMAFAQGAAGAFAARAACDAVLKRYWPRAIFFAVAAALILLTLWGMFTLPFEWRAVTSIVGFAAWGYFFHQAFWSNNLI